MTTGIIRRIDDLGRIVIPKEIRRRCGLSYGDPLEIGIEDNHITLTPYRPYAEDQISAQLEVLADWYDSIEDYQHAETIRKMQKELRNK